MANFKRKSKWKSILCGILVVATLIGACAGLAALSKKETKTIGSGAFERGALDENGVYVESKTSIYTKKAFDCIGLRVEPDFEFKGTYDVYYYDNDDGLLDKIEGISGVYDEDHYFSYRARIVIHPELSEDEEEIGFFDVYKYAKLVKITVNKEQDNNLISVNLYNDSYLKEQETFESHEVGDTLTFVENENIDTVHGVPILENYKTLHVYLRRPEIQSDVNSIGVYVSKDNTIISSTTYNMLDVRPGEWFCCTFEVPEWESGMTFSVRMPYDCECYIFACGGCSVCD